MTKRIFFILACALVLVDCTSTANQEAAASSEEIDKQAALKFFRTECEARDGVLPESTLDACAQLYYAQHQLQQAVGLSGTSGRAGSMPDQNTTLDGDTSNKVYQASECIGAVVNNVCHGSVIDTQPMRQRCHGQMIGGRCTGPQF